MWRTTPCRDRVLTVWVFGTRELVELVASAESNQIQYVLDMRQHALLKKMQMQMKLMYKKVTSFL